MAESYVIGVDFGSDSVRALIVNTETGENVGQGVACYPRWKAGLYQHPEYSIFRQHPLDYLESLEKCITTALAELTEEQKDYVIGIGVDTTGSTPVPVDKNGIPLALLDEFAENYPYSQFLHVYPNLSYLKFCREVSMLNPLSHQSTYSQYKTEKKETIINIS